MSDFKKLVYEKVVTVLNLNTQGLVFAGGYLLAWHNGIPYHIDQSSLSQFDWNREEIIPVSEEFNQETPSVNGADRSDYIAQYQIMFRLSADTTESMVQTALEEYRTYMFANKQHVIDGYKVSFKVTRGDKQPNFTIEGGSFYGYYKLTVYFTAIKNGYIYKDADTVSIRIKDTGSYEVLIETEEATGNAGNPVVSDASGTSKGLLTTMTLNNTIRFYYNSSTMEKAIYAQIQNKGNKNQLFDIKTIFDGITYDYVAIITGGGKTKSPNGAAILEFNWMEADE